MADVSVSANLIERMLIRADAMKVADYTWISSFYISCIFT